MPKSADGMQEFPDLTEVELAFRALLQNRYRLRLFVRECVERREASGEAERDRKRYAVLAAKNGWL